MSRADIISQLSKAFPDMRKSDVERATDIVLETIITSLEQGARVELRGFGAFTVRHRPTRSGRNPRTGDPVEIAPTHVPFFKPGKELRILLNRNDAK